MKRLELKIPPVAVFAIFAGAMWGLDSQCPFAALSISWKWPLALALFVPGLIGGMVGVLTFFKAHTTVHPGRPEHAAALVTSGIYRFTRNPMYLGLLLMLASWSLVLANGLAMVLLPAFVVGMNRLQIIPEERILRAKFGNQFDAYARTVRRWL